MKRPSNTSVLTKLLYRQCLLLIDCFRPFYAHAKIYVDNGP